MWYIFVQFIKGYEKKLAELQLLTKYGCDPSSVIKIVNMASFFRFVNQRAIYRLGIISLAQAQMHVNDFPVVNVHIDDLSSARIWQQKFRKRKYK